MKYTIDMPRLWTDTIETHRREVREAILDATANLVAEHGLRAVTMSQVAEDAGVARATLYKYFPDVEAILVAWHERHINDHLQHLVDLRDRAHDAGEALEAVLEAYAIISFEIAHRHHGSHLMSLLHQGEHVGRAQDRLQRFIKPLLAEGVKGGYVRDDVPLGELANYCLHALAAAAALPTRSAVRRLVAVALAGLRAGARTPGRPARRRPNPATPHAHLPPGDVLASSVTASAE